MSIKSASLYYHILLGNNYRRAEGCIEINNFTCYPEIIPMFKICSRASTEDDKYRNPLATNALKINVNHRIPESTCQSMYDEVRNAIFNHTGRTLRLMPCKEIPLEIN